MDKNEYIYKRDILASLNKISKSLELIAESLKVMDFVVVDKLDIKDAPEQDK